MDKTRIVNRRLPGLALPHMAIMGAALIALAACAGGSPPRPSLAITSGAPYPDTRPAEQIMFGAVPVSILNGPTAGDEYFSAAAYGVAASPRVALGAQMPRGGGVYKIGSPYTVAGKRYYPTRTPKKVQTGSASWYGAAFHGRKTANGEIYDMNHLTAAHKTMPLPSYARVTNLANNRSIIVRVNDRGPFSNNRIIDLSKRAADLLDYTRAGTARVQVNYLGPAPLHGNDDAYLASSFQAPRGTLGGALTSYVSADDSTADYASRRVENAFSALLSRPKEQN